MKKMFILMPLLGLFAYVVLSSSASGPGSPSAGSHELTGASGGTVGCGGSGCHNAASATIVAPTIQLMSGTTPVTTYTPGGSYTIAVGSPTVTGLSKFGFQLAAMKVGSVIDNAGTFTAIAGTHVIVPLGTPVKVVEHSAGALLPTSGFYVVNIPWTAPAAGFGPVKLFAVLNAVNANGSADAGDLWNSTTATINESSSTVGAITGTKNICPGNNSALTCTPAGGTWSSTTPAVATVSSSGMVTGVAAGTTTISYVTGVGTATAIVTVMAAPGPVTGTATVCIGATTTLSSTPVGGVWSSGAPTIATVVSATGVVTGVASGTAVISYANTSGCTSTKIVTVNASGAATITGTNNVCVGTTITLSNLTPGGTWASSTPAKATVNATTGVVTGVAVGTTTISYTATNACGSGTTTKTVNVLAAGACTSGVGSTAATETGLSIYPNPNNGAFTMNLHTDVNEEAHIIVCNISGEKVKEFTAMTNTAVDMRLPHVAGMYFVSVSTSQGNFVSRLVIQ